MAKRPGAGGIIVVALALGIGAAILIYQWAAEQKKHSKENWKPVVTAVTEIQPQTKITREMLMLMPMPPENIAEGAATTVDEVIGKISLAPYRPKDQVRLKDLVREDQMPGLAAKVPPGMRAVAIEASEVMAVGTGVKPGNHVDILATFHDPLKKEDLTKIILQDVEVLAVNKADTSPNSKEGATTSMTVAVKPEQTELLTAATKAGAVRVSLRAMNDNNIVPTTGTTVVDIGGRPMLQPTVAPTSAATAEPKSAQVPVSVISIPSRTRPEITIIRGVTEQVVSPQ
jgi:pilus assembly protein CpaB